MNTASVIIASVLALLVIAVLVWLFAGRKKSKGCKNCSGCPYSDDCDKK